jgi:outer membrane protein TolC
LIGRTHLEIAASARDGAVRPDVLSISDIVYYRYQVRPAMYSIWFAVLFLVRFLLLYCRNSSRSNEGSFRLSKPDRQEEQAPEQALDSSEQAKERKMKIRMIYVLLLAALAGRPSQAGEPLVIDVDTALELARSNNLKLQSQYVDLRMKERAQRSAWNSLLPSLNARVGSSFPLPSETSSSSGGSTASLTAGLSANLSVSSELRYQIRNALLEYEAGTISLETVKKQLDRDLSKSFYNLLLIEEEIKLIRQNIATAQRRYDQARARYDKGLIPELDVLNAQMTLENFKPTLEDSRVTYETALMQFKELLGLERETVIELKGDIVVQEVSPDIEQQIQGYLSGNLDVQSLVKNIQILENQRKLLRAGDLGPVFSLSYGYSASLHDPLQADWGSSDSYSQGGTLALSASLPLDGWLPGSQSRVKISDLEDTLQMAHLELSRTLRETEDTIISLLLSLNKSIHTIAVREQNVSLAQKTYDLTERQYNAGVIDLISVEEAYDDLQKAKHDLLAEKYAYQTALLDLEYTLNVRMWKQD